MSEVETIAGTVELRSWDDSSRGLWTVNVLVNGRNVGVLVVSSSEFAVLSAGLGSGGKAAQS